MAHMIEFLNGKYNFAYAGEPTWHGLGKLVSPDLTPDQIMVEAGADWTVAKIPLTVNLSKWHGPAGNKTATKHSALVRESDGNILDIVTDDWNPVQNSEAFNFFHDFVAAGDMQMHTAGVLRDGKTVFALAKVNDGFTLDNGDSVDSYLLFTNNHEYGKATDIRFTPIRVVCNNTLTMALGGKVDKVFKAGHRTAFNAETAKLALGVAHEKLVAYKEAAEFLASKRYTVESMKEYFKEIYPVTGANIREKEMSRPANICMDIIEQQPGAEFAKGSWWNAFNAVTFFSDHMQGSNDNRAYNAMIGTVANLKAKALEKAVEYAKAA